MNGKGTTYQSAIHCASNYAPVPALADYSFTSDENADAPTLDTVQYCKKEVICILPIVIARAIAISKAMKSIVISNNNFATGYP